MTIAAVSARLEIALFGNPAELERFGHVMGDRFLHPVHFLLCIQKTTSDRVVEKGLALLFEGGNFIVAQLAAGLLSVLEILALLAQGLVLAADLVVGHECVEALTNPLELGLIKDSLAKLFGLLNDDRIFAG